MSGGKATVPADPNNCGYKLTMETLRIARDYIVAVWGAKVMPPKMVGGVILSRSKWRSARKSMLDKIPIPYKCAVCPNWHFRGKDSESKNMV